MLKKEQLIDKNPLGIHMEITFLKFENNENIMDVYISKTSVWNILLYY